MGVCVDIGSAASLLRCFLVGGERRCARVKQASIQVRFFLGVGVIERRGEEGVPGAINGWV